MSRLIPFIGFLIAIGLFFGYINPTMSGPIAQTKQEIKSYDSALDAAKRFKEKEALLAAERAKIPPEGIVQLESFLPDGADNVQLILDLDSLASQTGLKLSQFSTSQTPDAQPDDGIVIPEGAPVGSIQLATGGTGSYAAFRTFLDATERSLRPLDLINLSIERAENGTYDFDMVFRVYWLR